MRIATEASHEHHKQLHVHGKTFTAGDPIWLHSPLFKGKVAEALYTIPMHNNSQDDLTDKN